MKIFWNCLYLLVLSTDASILQLYGRSTLDLLQCGNLGAGVCRLGTTCPAGEFPVYPFTCAIYSFLYGTEYTRCVTSMPCCYWTGATCRTACSSDETEMDTQTATCNGYGDRCCMRSTSPASTQSPATGVTAVRACRQRCYDRSIQLQQAYCPVPRACWYTYHLVLQTYACYDACNVYLAVDVPSSSSPAAAAAASVTTPVRMCRQYCYETSVNQLQQLCPPQSGYSPYCPYASALSTATNNCYRDCSMLFNTTLSGGAAYSPTFPGPINSISCGNSLAQQLPRFQYTNRIVGGDVTEECQFPWAVYLRVGNTFCGGSIIDTDTIVTAAHCVVTPSGQPVEASTVVVHYNSSTQSLTKRAGVSRVLVNTRFRRPFYDYDVALLTLTRPLEFDNCNQPICLPEADAQPWGVCLVAGWGTTDASQRQTQQVLRQVTVPVVNQQDCLAAYRGDTRVINDLKVCAGKLQQGGADACLGDSGGPLMCQEGPGRTFTLHGLVSFGQGCGQPGYPGVYTRTGHPDIIAWIRGNM